MNSEGLTQAEWMNAATMGGKFKPAKGEKALMLQEWKAGVDPTEWASYLEKSYVPTFPKQQPVRGIPLTPELVVVGAAIRRKENLHLFEILQVELWDKDPFSKPAMSVLAKDLVRGGERTLGYEFLEYWVLQPDPQIFLAWHFKEHR